MTTKRGRSSKAKRYAAQSRAAQARQNARLARADAVSLLSHRRKLGRAETHIQEVERLVEGWLKPGSYRIAVQPDVDGGVEVAGTQLKPLPAELGLIIGDALQAMRSSLDNLAYALVMKNNPDLTPREEEGISFPVFNKPAMVGHKSVNQMGRIIAVHVIGLCPDPAISPVNEHPLWLLNKANNRDKHRAVTVAVASIGHYSMQITNAVIQGDGFIGAGGPQRTKHPGDKVVFAKGGPGSHFDANVSASLQIVFDEGGEIANREVTATLRWFHDHIRDAVFQALEPYL